MSIFSSIGKALTGPFRGIHNILKGDWKSAIGAFGDVVKPGAAVLAATGVGAPLAVPLGALGGAMQKADDPGQRGIADILKGAAGGAALAGTAGAARSLLTAAPGAVSGAPGGVGATPGMASMVASGAPTAATNVATQATPSILSRIGGAAKDVAGWAGKNPQLASSVVSGAADVYGAEQQRKAYEKQLALEEELERKRAEREQLQLLMSAYSSAMPRFSF